jgi:hypothetical protein
MDAVREIGIETGSTFPRNYRKSNKRSRSLSKYSGNREKLDNRTDFCIEEWW